MADNKNHPCGEDFLCVRRTLGVASSVKRRHEGQLNPPAIEVSDNGHGARSRQASA
jgi:hypothetical protein